MIHAGREIGGGQGWTLPATSESKARERGYANDQTTELIPQTAHDLDVFEDGQADQDRETPQGLKRLRERWIGGRGGAGVGVFVFSLRSDPLTEPEIVSDFELVWKAYPRKVGKGAARKVWAKLQPDTATVQKMLDGLVWQKLQPQWLRDGGQYIPHFATWLNQERWEDEPVALPQFGSKTVNSLRAIYGDVH